MSLSYKNLFSLIEHLLLPNSEAEGRITGQATQKKGHTLAKMTMIFLWNFNILPG